MLDQDPDALIAIDERMSEEDYGVAPMPKGPDGKTFPPSAMQAGPCSPTASTRRNPGS
jgi:hypothetical protein